MKKDTKQRLFEVMSRLDPSFKRLNENLTNNDIIFNKLVISNDDILLMVKGYLKAGFEATIYDFEDDIRYYGDDDMGGELYENVDFQKSIIGLLEDYLKKLETTPITIFLNTYVENNTKNTIVSDIKTFIENSGENAIYEAVKLKGYEELGYDLYMTRNNNYNPFIDKNYVDSDILIQSAKDLGRKEIIIHHETGSIVNYP